MNLCVVNTPGHAEKRLDTSIDTPRMSAEIPLLWAALGTNGVAALGTDEADHSLLFRSGTTSGWLQPMAPLPSQAGVAELRRRTRLTWAQLSRALGVQPRSLHFWARGDSPSAANLERLMTIVSVVRTIDRGNAAETTAFLLAPDGANPSPYALFCEGRDAEVLERIFSSSRFADRPSSRRRRPPRLSTEQRANRRGGVSPVEILVALHDEEAALPLGRPIATVPIHRRAE